MRTLTYFVGLFFAGAVFADPPTPSVIVANPTSDPVPVIVQNTTLQAQRTLIEYRYVGNTVATTNGDVGPTPAGLEGLAGLNDMCVAEFGRSARVSTPLEASAPPFLSSSVPDALAWVHSRSLVIGSVDNQYEARDSETGIRAGVFVSSHGSAYGVANCSMWAISGAHRQGIVRGTIGRIGPATCDALARVACSAQVSLPAT